MKRKKTLDEVYDWVTNGIFYQITENHEVAWKGFIDPRSLDLEYYGNVSGNKYISRLVDKLLEKDGTLSAEKQRILARLVFDKYNIGWQKMWDAITAEYDPVNGYHMVKTEDYTKNDNGQEALDNTIIKEDTGTIDTQNRGTVKVDTTGNPSVTTDGDNDDNVGQSIYGVDSEEASPSNNTNTHSTNHEETKNTLDEHNVKEDTTGNLETRNLNNTKTENKNKQNTNSQIYTSVVKRDGNIGNVSPQQLVGEELTLRRRNFFNDVYKDVDEILVVNIFKEEDDNYDCWI